MIRLVSSSAAIAATLALAACGGGGSATSTSAASSGADQFVRDTGGKTLYASDPEATGKVLCTGACTSFWKPAAPGTVPRSAGKVGTVTRPDGSRQATIDGKPVYTFVEDSEGEASGDGFTDDFGGHHFVWHAITAGGGGSTTQSGGSDRGGYGY